MEQSKSGSNYLSLIVTGIIIIAIFAASGVLIYYNRCSIITCQPASWAEVRQIITEQQYNDNAKQIHPSLIYIHARIRNIQSLDTLDQSTVEYSVIYTPITYEQQDQANIKYHYKSIKFDDQYLRITQDLSRSTGEPINHEQIQVDPRTVYRKTYPIALELIGDMSFSNEQLLSIERFDDTYQQPIWWISFRNSPANKTILFVVDAQTGDIIFHSLSYYDFTTGKHISERIDYQASQSE
jgi:hypothetical protein